jgi:hypothetical protein
MIIKEVELNGKVYVVEIREIDKDSYVSQQIAVAKAYAKVEDQCHYRLIQRTARLCSFRDQNQEDKDMVNIWHKAFIEDKA